MILKRNRKTVAICVAGYNSECEAKIINGIVEKCKQSGMEVLIFSPLMLKGDYPKNLPLEANTVRGESEILNLINYDLLDGLFLFSETFYDKNAVLKVALCCDEKNVPFVSVHSPSFRFKHNAIIEESYAMELVVEHLIREHGLKKLDFIGGYPGNKESDDRLNAYKRILEKYKIPVDEKRIAYGHFWKHSVECAKQLLKRDVPDAFVCANDTMAIMVSDYLKNLGYKIPVDVVVTGFDGIIDGEIYSPSLTTLKTDFETFGHKTYEFLAQLMQGEDVPDVSVQPELITRESCGCCAFKKPDFNYIDLKYISRNESETFRKNLIKTDVFFAEAKTFEELLSKLIEQAGFFDFEKFYFCINDDILSVRQEKYGVSENMTAYFADAKGGLCKKSFKSKSLLPEEFLRTKGSVTKFSPLYYKNTFLGYVAYSTAYGKKFGDCFPLWLLNAANAIGSFCVNNQPEI